jgi:16S rRNA (guanine966-N2)-methyltransferase
VNLLTTSLVVNQGTTDGTRIGWKTTMRVIAGTYRSRQLRSLRGLDLRPTADRLRETLFDVLTAGNPVALEGSVWIDLYAGTGAVGIEGLSRGAEKVYFVESAKSAAELIRQNLASLGIASGFEILQQDAIRALCNLGTRGIAGDFVFLDPPYQLEEAYKDGLRALAELSVLKPNGMVIAEHEKRFDPGDEFVPLRRYRKLEQGDAALSFYRKI